MYKESRFLTNWRIDYKKKHGGIENYKYIHGYEILYESYEVGIITKEKEIKKYEIPIYESPIFYPFLKHCSEQIEMAIPRVFKERDDNYNTKFTLKQSPLIITNCDHEDKIDSGSGPVCQDINYIEFDSFFVIFIENIGRISTHLFDFNTKNEISDIKKLMYINFEKNPDIYMYFRGIFYRIMVYPKLNRPDEEKNISKMIDEEWSSILKGNIPPPYKTDIFSGLKYVIVKIIGLFIMGHEYSHCICDEMYSSYDSYVNNLFEYYQKEYNNDEMALKLMWDCMQHEFNQDSHEMKNTRWCFFIGVIIILNCFYINDSMCEYFNCNYKPIESKKHSQKRIERIWLEIEKLGVLKKEDMVFLDAVDYIFKRMRERLINELENNEHVLSYRKSRNIEIECSEVLYLRSEYKTSEGNVHIVNNIDKKIIMLCEKILSEAPNNITALFILGDIYIDKKQYEDALKNVNKIIDIAKNKIFIGRMPDLGFYLVRYLEGAIYIRKALNMIRNNDWKLNNDQKKEKDKLFDKAIEILIDTSQYYNHGNALFYELGVAYSYKNEYQKAIKNFKKAFEYLPDFPREVPARHGLIVNLAKFSGLIPLNFIIKAAKKGDSTEQYLLGYYYEYGFVTPVDIKKAFYWYEKAAKKGFAPAQYKTGFFYENVKRKNINKANYWYTKAAVQGYPPAKIKIGK